MNQTNQTEEELERFRREWREEVTKRAKPQASGATPRASQSSARAPGSSYHPHFERKAPVPTVPSVAADKHAHLDGADDVESKAYHDLEEKQYGHTLSGSAPTQPKEPVSALDHYEKAVERESQGNLGDSVGLYRKAFKVSHYNSATPYHSAMLNASAIAYSNVVSQNKALSSEQCTSLRSCNAQRQRDSPYNAIDAVLSLTMIA